MGSLMKHTRSPSVSSSTSSNSDDGVINEQSNKGDEKEEELESDATIPILKIPERLRGTVFGTTLLELRDTAIMLRGQNYLASEEASTAVKDANFAHQLAKEAIDRSTNIEQISI